MSALSDTFTQLSLDLIEQFGESATFSRQSTATYDPTQAEAAEQTISTYTSNVVPEEYKFTEIDGTIIQTGDIKLLTGLITGYIPEPNDSVTFNSKSYRIVNVSETILNSATVLYTLQVRV